MVVIVLVVPSSENGHNNQQTTITATIVDSIPKARPPPPPPPRPPKHHQRYRQQPCGPPPAPSPVLPTTTPAPSVYRQYRPLPAPVAYDINNNHQQSPKNNNYGPKFGSHFIKNKDKINKSAGLILQRQQQKNQSQVTAATPNPNLTATVTTKFTHNNNNKCRTNDANNNRSYSFSKQAIINDKSKGRYNCSQVKSDACNNKNNNNNDHDNTSCKNYVRHITRVTISDDFLQAEIGPDQAIAVTKEGKLYLIFIVIVFFYRMSTTLLEPLSSLQSLRFKVL